MEYAAGECNVGSTNAPYSSFIYSTQSLTLKTKLLAIIINTKYIALASLQSDFHLFRWVIIKTGTQKLL